MACDVVVFGMLGALLGVLTVLALHFRGSCRAERSLNAELRHRLRNCFALAAALTRLATRGHEDEPDAVLPALQDRLIAMARATGSMGGGRNGPKDVRTLASMVLEPVLEDGRVRLLGTAIALPERSCLPLGLALHELASNALKHGALSKDGTVVLAWREACRERRRILVIRWQERGGPPVATPTRTGMGSALLQAQPGLDEVTLRFAAQGVRCRLVVSVETGFLGRARLNFKQWFYRQRPERSARRSAPTR